MTLVDVDIETLTKKIQEAHILLILMSNKYIEGLKDPHDVQHIALNLQIQEAAKGEKEVYLICDRPIEKKNFTLLLDMLEGSNLKTILFIDRDNEDDLKKATTLLRYLMGPAKISGTSKDAWKVEKR